MSLVPTPTGDEPRPLVFATAEAEAVVVAAALTGAGAEAPRLIFEGDFGLGGLGSLPAYRDGRARTLLVGFPAVALARDPAAAAAALRAASDLTWVTGHPVPAEDLAGARGARLLSLGADPGGPLEGLVEGAAAVFARLASVLRELPDPLPPFGAEGRGLAYRLAVEGSREEPHGLASLCRAMARREPPPSDLVGAGRHVVLERRELARTSAFHRFGVQGGQGVLVMAPRSANGAHRDVAREARVAKGCLVSLLAFDSNEPALVEYDGPRPELAARLALAASRLPGYGVRGWGAAGFAVRGAAAGSLEVLEALMRVLAEELTEG